MNIRKLIRSVLNENYPAGAATDPNAPWNKPEPKYSSAVKPKAAEFNTIAVHPGELAIMVDAAGNKYSFYFGHMSKSDFEPYAEREIIGAEKGWEYGEVDYEYSDDWEIDNHVVDGYVNDNLNNLTRGEGLGAWEDGIDIVKIDEPLKSDILSTFGANPEIQKALV